MFALKNESTGEWATGRYCRFTYGTRQLALAAARILGKEHKCVYRVVPA